MSLRTRRTHKVQNHSVYTMLCLEILRWPFEFDGTNSQDRREIEISTRAATREISEAKYPSPNDASAEDASIFDRV